MLNRTPTLVLEYLIILNNTKTGVVKNMTVPVGTNTATLTDLTGDSLYVITIRGVSKHGAGAPYAPIQIQSPRGAPTAAPEGAEATNLNSTAVSLNWSPIPPEYANAPLLGYSLIATPLNGTSAGAHNSISVFTCNTSVAIAGLAVYTAYALELRAFNEPGFGPPSNTTFVTGEEAPDASPAITGITDVTATTALMRWSPLPAILLNGLLRSYIITITNNATGSSVSVTAPGHVNEFMLRGLMSSTTYDVTLRAITIAAGPAAGILVNTSEMSEPVTTTSNVTASNISPNSSTITWQHSPAEETSGELKGYRVRVYDSLRDSNSTYLMCMGNRSAQLADLDPYTRYEVYVSVFNALWTGRESPTGKFITSEGVPSKPPQNLTAHNTSSTTLALSFRPPEKYFVNGKLRGYNVTWRETLLLDAEVFSRTVIVTSSAKRRRRAVETSDQESLQLDGLKKYTTYTITVAAFTIGDGPFLEVNATTAEDVPSLPPPNVIAYNTSSTSIAVSWQHIPEGHVHGILLGYHVFVTPYSNVTPSVYVIGPTKYNVMIGNLGKYTEYHISVAGFTLPGTGNVSEIVTTYTDEDVPDSPPLSLYGEGPTPTSLSLTWQPVPTPQRNGIILGYTVNIRLNDTSLDNSTLPWNTTVLPDAAILSLEVPGLAAWTAHRVRINAFTRIGPGPWSADVVITGDRIPPPPTDVNTINITSTSITVTWTGIDTSTLRVPLRGYRVLYSANSSIFSDETMNVTAPAGAVSKVVSGLHEFTDYNFWVLAIVDVDGIPSEMVSDRTLPDVPSSSPTILSKLTLSADSLMLVFVPPPPEDINGVISSYEVTLESVNASSVISRTSYGPTERIVTLSGLKEGVLYNISVIAVNQVGSSPPASEATKLHENSVAQNRYSADTIPLDWPQFPPEVTHGAIINYRVRYRLVELGGDPIRDSPTKEILVPGPPLNLTDLETFAKYEVEIVWLTSDSVGPEIIVFAETCRCRDRLITNWRPYNPYTYDSQANGEPEGIIPAVVREMAVACCEKCLAFGFSRVDFEISADGIPAEKSNEKELLGNISEAVDFSFPVYGSRDQLKYKSGFMYRALVESPGFVYIVNTDSGKSPAMMLIAALLTVVPYLVLTIALAYIAGFVLWAIDRRANPEFFPPSYIRGQYEGLWWAFITMTTLGYGDRFPMTWAGKLFGIFWMLTGIVVYGILCGYLVSAVSRNTVDINNQLYGAQILAIEGSPEARLGIRLNAQVNPDEKPQNFEELYRALRNKKSYGALLDAYAIGHQRHLFEDPNLRMVRLYDFKSAYGVVMANSSTRMTKCFRHYIQNNTQKIFNRIKKYVRFYEKTTDIPSTIEYAYGLFSAETPTFRRTLYFLLGLLGTFTIAGSLYNMRRRAKKRAKATAKARSSVHKEVAQELKDDIHQLSLRMREINEKLTKKHARELLARMRIDKQKSKLYP
ncbi:protein sidekick-1 [Nematostella vectensis]|uniref:protein sidekick-1 n=1 Tax=Nematostella vectensis TaxID=45351 RepID=UPI002076FA3A|nr:protein sidekick-1 [Nematostella vectensis]